MSRGTAWFVHGATLAVGGTGLVYGWMRYWVVPDDEFALVNHPWQPDVKAWHILLAPFLLFAVGVLWRHHVWGRIRSRNRDRLRTGILLAALFAPMVVSGPALQTAVDDGWRLLWIWVHGITSVLWVVIYLVHQCLRVAGGSVGNPRSSREKPASARSPGS